MYSKSIPSTTITTTVLNSTAGYTADATLTVSNGIINTIPQNVGSLVLLPKSIEIVNKTGVDLEWVILANDDEIAMYAANVATPGTYPYFGFTLLPNNSVLSNSNLPACKNFIIRSVGGSGATSGLRIDFAQYR